MINFFALQRTAILYWLQHGPRTMKQASANTAHLIRLR